MRTGLIAGKGRTSVGIGGMQMRWGRHGVKSAPGIVRLSHPVIAFTRRPTVIDETIAGIAEILLHFARSGGARSGMIRFLSVKLEVILRAHAAREAPILRSLLRSGREGRRGAR